MIVECLSFGSLWWLRPGNSNDDPRKFTTKAAVFNTTGFCHGAREHRNWTVAGVVRFNAGTLNEQRIYQDDLIQEQFHAPGLERMGSWNRLLLSRKVRHMQYPDAILVNIRSQTVGRIVFGSHWRTSGIRIVASSSFGDEQETLLLMTPDSEITTQTGKWRCVCNKSIMSLVQAATRTC